VASFKRAPGSHCKGIFAREIEPVQVPAGREVIIVAEDETPKKFNEEKLRKLRPAFGEKARSQRAMPPASTTGAAALVVVSAGKVKALGLKPQARILGYATFSREAGMVHARAYRSDWEAAEAAFFASFCGGPLRKSTRRSLLCRWPP